MELIDYNVFIQIAKFVENVTDLNTALGYEELCALSFRNNSWIFFFIFFPKVCCFFVSFKTKRELRNMFNQQI